MLTNIGVGVCQFEVGALFSALGASELGVGACEFEVGARSSATGACDV